MVYESDFYTTRRPYTSRPNVSSYSVTTPRYYRVTDTTHPRSAEQQYSYSYSSTSQSTRDSSNPYGSRPERSSYTSTSERKTTAGPRGDYYTSERSSTTGSRPGDYSYSSTSTGRLPHGTNYRHFSYRV